MVLCIIQARMGSTRLPNKVLMEFKGGSNLYHVIRRVKQSKKVDNIVIATTIMDIDNEIEKWGNRNNIKIFRGSEDDVLDRFYKCAKTYKLKEDDIVVRITADCPLIDPNIIDEVIDFYNENDCDYATNSNPPTYPDGMDVEVFSYKVLEIAWKEAFLKSEREHVTPYITNNIEKFKICNLLNSVDYSHYRLTLDEEEDYKLIAKIYEELYTGDKVFLMDTIIKFLEENPEITKINSDIKRNEGYEKSLQND